MDLDITETHIKHYPVERTVDECSSLVTQCKLQSHRCIEPNATHVIDGISVTEACGDEEYSYQCGNAKQRHDCDQYRKAGCQQVGSTCQQSNQGQCELFEQTFNCPKKDCHDDGAICNGKVYCLEGDCLNQPYPVDSDFEKSVSQLSAIAGAAQNFTGTGKIFGGVKKSCDKLAFGYLDCCKDSGWGNELFSRCSQQERDLMQDKKNKVAVYAGEFCNKKDVLGGCLEKRSVWCVFPSKIAKIIQEKGRAKQLKIPFYKDDSANCRGLTREEFANLKLDQIDFSDFYEDLNQKKHIEANGSIDKRVTDLSHDLHKKNIPTNMEAGK